MDISEKEDLFQRFKDKDIDKLLKLSVTFKAHKNYEKAQLVDLLIDIKTQDIEGLKKLVKTLSRSGALTESVYANSLLQGKLLIKAEERNRAIRQKIKNSLEKVEETNKSIKQNIKNTLKKNVREEDKTAPPLGLSEEVYDAMTKRIGLNSQRHRERIKKISETD